MQIECTISKEAKILIEEEEKPKWHLAANNKGILNE